MIESTEIKLLQHTNLLFLSMKIRIFNAPPYGHVQGFWGGLKHEFKAVQD